MESNLKQLLNVSQNLIPDLIEAYNKDTAEYHAMWDELDELREFKEFAESNINVSEEMKVRLNELSVALDTKELLIKTNNDEFAQSKALLNEKINSLKVENDKLITEIKDIEVSTSNHSDELYQELREQDELIGKLQDTVTQQNGVLETQRKSLDTLFAKNEAVIKLARQTVIDQEKEIAALNVRLANAENSAKNIETLKTKMEKEITDLKTKLSIKTKAFASAEGELRNERRVSQGLRLRLETQKIGIWQAGQERVIPYLNGDVIQRKDLVNDTSVTIAAWWQHECGLKILCAYDKASDSIYMCDPSNENGNMHTPTSVAEKVMLVHFRSLDKQINQGKK